MKTLLSFSLQSGDLLNLEYRTPLLSLHLHPRILNLIVRPYLPVLLLQSVVAHT